MKRYLALLTAVLGLLALATPVAAQDQDQQSGPTVLVVHEVDAREASTLVTVLADDYRIAQDIEIKQDGDKIDPTRVRTATEAGIKQEIVFVVDANSNLAAGNVFETVTQELSAAIRNLPSGTTVSVISAGVIATVVVEPTTDLQKASATVLNMRQSGKSSIFGALDLAGGLLSSGDHISTVMVFSGNPDPSQSVDPLTAGQLIVANQAQVVSLRFDGGEERINKLVDVAGGLNVGTADPAGVAEAVRDAVAASSNRILIEFPGLTENDQRSNVSITLGDARTEFNYQGDRLTRSMAALESVAAETGTLFSIFHNSLVLYAALAVLFVGLGLAVFAFGSIFASGESSLESLINRYSGEGEGELNDEESAIVQTALVRRAVEMSETFAEDRGFLAKVEKLLERARLPLRPGEAMSIYLVAIFFSAAIGFIVLGGLVGAVILASLAGFIQIAVVQFLAKRRIKQFVNQLPDTLQLLASTLRAGYSLPQGLEAVSHEISDPMGFELRRAMTEARLGREVEDALAGIAERLESEDFAWVVMAIGIQREVGGNLNELLMTVSDTMIARERLAGEVAALTAEGKMSAIMLGGMPPVLGLVMWIMNREYMDQLFITGMGNALLVAAVVSSLIGFVWMKKVITVNV